MERREKHKNERGAVRADDSEGRRVSRKPIACPFRPLSLWRGLSLYTSAALLHLSTPAMRLIEILSNILSIFGIYFLVQHVPFLLPRNLIPHVAAVLTEVRGLVDRAEANGAITDASKFRADLARYGVICSLSPSPLTGRHSFANQLLQMRTESQRAPGIFQQLVLAVRYRLTYKIYTLSLHVDDMKIKVEVNWSALLTSSASDSGVLAGSRRTAACVAYHWQHRGHHYRASHSRKQYV